MLLSAGDRIVGFLNVSRGGIFSTEQSHEMSMAIALGWPVNELAEHLWRAVMVVLPNFGVRKLVALMTPEQTRERAALEHLGFFAEGFLADYVLDEAGHTHDLVIMARVLQQPFMLQRGYASAVASCRSLAVAANRSLAIVNRHAPATADDVDGTAPADRPEVEFAHVAYRRAVRVPVTRRRRGSVAHALSVVGVLSLTLALLAGVVSLRERPSTTRESQVLAEGAVPPRSASSFSASYADTGAVFLPVTTPTIDVLLALPESADAGWFWCVESSFGMPLAEHRCGSSGDARKGPTGELITDAIVHIDPSWPADARYFVAMYCPGPVHVACDGNGRCSSGHALVADTSSCQATSRWRKKSIQPYHPVLASQSLWARRRFRRGLTLRMSRSVGCYGVVPTIWLLQASNSSRTVSACSSAACAVNTAGSR